MTRFSLYLRSVTLLGVAAVILCTVRYAEACTRILWNNNKLAVVVSRTMDWPESTEPVLTIFPRAVKHDGGRLGGAIVVPVNPATWTSRYGSVVTTVYGIGTADGLNERGLAAHLLFLTATDFGPRDAARPGLHAGLWAQYALDNAATVTEALSMLEKVQIVMVEARGRQATVHLALEDAGGDSAIIEIIHGKSVVHHGKQYRVMTNDPVYDEQLALLAQQDYRKPSSTLTIPGNVNPVDRFQRASYYVALLPEPKNEREAVAGVLAIARNVSVPFGAPYKDFGIYNTEYRTVCNLTNRTYYFELTTSPNVVWVDLARENLAAGAPVMLLDPDDVALSGNVTASFHPASRAPF
jgi:choloylglycine hydrolase